MNIIQIAGHLGSDPETRFTPSGQKVTNFRVATNVRKGGKDVTIWWRVTVWGDRFDKMMPYFKKGSAIFVVGEMNDEPKPYTNKDGNQQVSLEITANNLYFSPFGKQDRANDQQQQSPASFNQPYGAENSNGFGSHQQPFASQTSRGAGDMAFNKSTASDMDEDSIPF